MPIPNEVMRLLRKEAGYGCAKCGFPFVEYHHIIQFHIENHNRPEDMVAFCPNCHHEANINAMNETEQRFFKANPFNITRGNAEGMLKVNQKSVAIDLGTVQIVNNGKLIVVNNEILFKLSIDSNSRLEISIKLYDENDNLLLEIDQNNWLFGISNIWDLDYKFNWIKLRSIDRCINLEVDAKQNPVYIRADLWKNGTRIRLNRKGIFINKSGINRFLTSYLCYVGMYFDLNSIDNSVKLIPDESIGKGMLVSWEDKKERILKGIEAYKTLLNNSQQ